MKWFELLRQQYKCETIMFHTPIWRRKITKDMVQYMVKQLKQDVIPKLEKVSGVNSTSIACANICASRPRPKTICVGAAAAKTNPRRSMLFRRHLLYRPIFGAFRARRCSRLLPVPARGSRATRRAGKGPVTPEGDMGKERYRLVVEDRRTTPTSASSGRCSTTRAVSSPPATQGRGTYDFGFRHNPTIPRIAGRILPECLHNGTCDARRHAGNYVNEYRPTDS